MLDSLACLLCGPRQNVFAILRRWRQQQQLNPLLLGGNAPTLHIKLLLELARRDAEAAVGGGTRPVPAFARAYVTTSRASASACAPAPAAITFAAAAAASASQCPCHPVPLQLPLPVPSTQRPMSSSPTITSSPHEQPTHDGRAAVLAAAW